MLSSCRHYLLPMANDYDFLSQWQDQLATLLIVSEAKLVKGESSG